MNDTESLFSGFPAIDHAQWKSKVLDELKGADYSKVVWKTPDGFEMEPWYNRHTAARPAPEVPFRRSTNRWRICQKIAVTRLLDDPALLAGAVSGGADAIELHFENVPESAEIERLLGTLRTIELSRIALYVSGNFGQAAPLFDRLATLPGFALNAGALFFDALAAPNADLPMPTAEMKNSDFRTIAVDTVRFHEAGATTAQELAITLSGLTDCLSRLTEAGVALAEAAASIELVVACGTSHLPELAKLRALRAMWGQLLGAYGIQTEAIPEPRIFVRASTNSFSVLDPYTNLLRLSTEALAAIIGGCDTLQLAPFESAGSVSAEFSERVTRNIQLLLREESALDRVVDPAAGSFYIETLTAKLCRESWKLFQQIETEGGLTVAEANGSIAAIIASAAEARRKEIDTRRRTLVGVNRYTVPPSPEMVDAIQKKSAATEPDSYEKLRRRMIVHQSAGNPTPRAVLWLHGEAVKSQRVATFADDFLRSGGFEVLPGVALDADPASCAAILADKPQIVVLCWTGDDDLASAPKVCKAIHKADSECVVIMAAKPPAEADELLQAGLDRFIYTGCNAFADLLALQQKTGVL